MRRAFSAEPTSISQLAARQLRERRTSDSTVLPTTGSERQWAETHAQPHKVRVDALSIMFGEALSRKNPLEQEKQSIVKITMYVGLYRITISSCLVSIFAAETWEIV